MHAVSQVRAGRGAGEVKGSARSGNWVRRQPTRGEGLSNVPIHPIRLTPIPYPRPLQLPESESPQWRLLLVTKQPPVHASPMLVIQPKVASLDSTSVTHSKQVTHLDEPGAWCMAASDMCDLVKRGGKAQVIRRSPTHIT